MNTIDIDQLWDLAFNGNYIMSRALALAALSKIDPERFKRLCELVKMKNANHTRSDR
ncbi:MAG: hypothetical protein NTW33_02650 [Methanoregula sp.]|nr:hypothetical protein [Methanoregula sp.]